MPHYDDGSVKGFPFIAEMNFLKEVANCYLNKLIT